MTNKRYSNVIPIGRLNLAQSRLQLSTGKEPTNALASRISDGEHDYRCRMVTNAFVAGLVGMLVMSGQWMFTILPSVR